MRILAESMVQINLAKMLQRILFLLLAIGGVVLVFFVSWFWRLLLVPMIVVLLFDVVSSFFKGKNN